MRTSDEEQQEFFYQFRILVTVDHRTEAFNVYTLTRSSRTIDPRSSPRASVISLSPKSPVRKSARQSRALSRWIRGFRVDLPWRGANDRSFSLREMRSTKFDRRDIAPKRRASDDNGAKGRERVDPHGRSPRTISRAVNQSEQRTRPSVNACVQPDVIYLRTKTIISPVARDTAASTLAIAYPLLLCIRFFFVLRDTQLRSLCFRQWTSDGSIYCSRLSGRLFAGDLCDDS